MIKRIDWNLIPNKNTMQKRALKEAIEKAGNCNRLSMLTGIYRGTISHWLKRKINSRTKDLMYPTFALAIAKATKIKGISYRLCPSLKKMKKDVDML